MALPIRQPGKGPTTQVTTLKDFRGGLNLISDNFKLAPNETPNVVNLDFSERGGMSKKK